MSILQKLTEGVVNRDMRKEGAALLNKWEQTGLLEGLKGDVDKNNMARLLENQAKQLLKEAASTMSGGDVEGFAAVAFPIVRRVFGGLIANDLVSVQPMSLPSGLIFFLDFTFGGITSAEADDDARLDFAVGESVYGGGKVGAQLTGGVDLEGEFGTSAGQFYNLTNGYSSATGSNTDVDATIVASGTYPGYDGGSMTEAHALSVLRYDPALVSGSTSYVIAEVLIDTDLVGLNRDDLVSFTIENIGGAVAATEVSGTQLRRLTQFSSSEGDAPDRTSSKLLFVLATDTDTPTILSESLETPVVANKLTASFATVDNFTGSAALGSVVGSTSDPSWGLENNVDIPEINLKVDSLSVTAVTKKLKAKWTPELGQDLNAYHNLDAEVELTSILSEQIALEIDREIVEDLVKGAQAAVYYWSRSPGLFVERKTGKEIGASSAAPDFTGTVSEWYETLGETINDVSANIHRKTLRGGANFLVTSPEVANILEFTAGFRANVTHDDATGTAGTHQVGTLSKRYDVYVDPYFPRNLILVGRKGGSFLESGYVYAPYVPLQVTPTIFGVEDFVPRKGVMTRYAKKMVRPDMYGLVICRGLTGEAGATS